MVNIDNDILLYYSPKLFFVDSQQLLTLTARLRFLPLDVARDSAPHLPRLPYMWHLDVDFVFGEVQRNLEILTLSQCHLLLERELFSPCNKSRLVRYPAAPYILQCINLQNRYRAVHC